AGTARMDRGEAHRREAHLSARPAPALGHGRPGGGRADRPRLLRTELHPRNRERGGRGELMELRDLPSVDELARDIGDPLAVEVARAVIERAREEIRSGVEPGDLSARLETELVALRAPRLLRVLNATGVVVHTNLGRAPLAEAALRRVHEAARG